MSWELPLLTSLVLSVLGFWSLGSSGPRLGFFTTLAAVLSAAPFLVDHRRLLRTIYSVESLVLNDLRPDVLLATHFRMALTLGAVVWPRLTTFLIIRLLHRSWQTIWKPVPELINILGVDVPEPPDVCLAGIRADAATLSWTRPLPNRPVQKYLIQVNGIHVGESPGNEIAITVTGLKPDHFYNIRVVAMGPNNFQAASQTVRLRTFGKDGKPYLGNARLPTSFIGDEQSRPKGLEDDALQGSATCSFAAVEAAPVLDGSQAARRDSAGAQPGQRRNTINRRHSPSVTSADHQPAKQPSANDAEASLDELNRRFQEIRKEINDTVALLAADEAEYKQIEEELKRDKESKRHSLKEKEELTAGLKGQVRSTMESMRAAEKERSRKEQQLKDKEAKKSKVRDSISKLEQEMERMKKERDGFQAQKASLEHKRDSDVSNLQAELSKLQEDYNQLETDLSNKGKQLNEMKGARKHLPGADDEQVKESDERTRREWEGLRSALHHQLVEETKISHQLDQRYHALAKQVNLQHHQSGMAFYGPPDPTSGAMDHGAISAQQQQQLQQQQQQQQQQPKHPSLNSSADARMPPLDSQLPVTESPPQLPPGLTRIPPSFAPLLFLHNGDDIEEELRSAVGPLSPSAQAYLPSGIIDNETDTRPVRTPMLPESVAAREDDPQSPASSGHSFSVFSSPHSSSYKLPFPQYQDKSEQASLNMKHSGTAASASGHRLTSLLSGFQRNRGGRPGDDGEADEGLPIGSLKGGQSQSFPRGTDEVDITGTRRRMTLSLKSHRNSTGLDGSLAQALGGSWILPRRLNPFASSAAGNFFDRNPDGSRPASIASSDLLQPSADSGSIWNAPGADAGSVHRMWSPGDGWWGSRNGSRRPSNHGSPSALTTTLASADDEILYETELNDPQTLPSQDWPSDQPRMSRDAQSVDTLVSVSESHDSLPPDASHSSATNLEQLLSSSVSSTPRDAEGGANGVNGIRKLLRKGSSSSKFSLSSRLGKESGGGLFKKGPGSATTNSDRNASAEHRSSIGDLDDPGEDPTAQYGRSYDSITSSPSLGPAVSKESMRESLSGSNGKESRMSNWRFMKKKGKDATATTPSKEKESLEMDRTPDE
ncbi:Chromosome segregation ATPase [Geosmithia morbida]|uniref:Chromosome segregation ATPase n=1 Tax=Geosmithia morbida TaxID=1094350 RepID=A0A9P4Z0E7_9HYPO|nr:Chromosome segregation ATPase [Geosmithia morbida]KAF4125122.1 Chromosome segregation ATPase [Geosmithia morbida]